MSFFLIHNMVNIELFKSPEWVGHLVFPGDQDSIIMSAASGCSCPENIRLWYWYMEYIHSSYTSH